MQQMANVGAESWCAVPAACMRVLREARSQTSRKCDGHSTATAIIWKYGAKCTGRESWPSAVICAAPHVSKSISQANA